MKFTPRLNAATKTRVMIKPTESVLEIERGLFDSKFCILSPPFDRSRVNMLHPTHKMLPCRHHVQFLRHLSENLYHSEYCIFNPIEHYKGMTGETGSGHGFCMSFECEAVGPGATGTTFGCPHRWARCSRRHQPTTAMSW